MSGYRLASALANIVVFQAAEERRKAKREKKKEKEDQLRKEGKLLSKKQKEQQAKNEAFRKQLEEQGIVPTRYAPCCPSATE